MAVFFFMLRLGVGDTSEELHWANLNEELKIDSILKYVLW